MRHKISEFLTLEEIQNLYRQTDKTTLRGLRDFCILSLILHTGLRRHEIASLPRNSLQSQSGRVYLYARTKGDKAQKIPIKDLELLESLGRYLGRTVAKGEPTGPMFWSLPKGPDKKIRPISDETIRRLVEKYIKLAKISKRITPHSLRHTFITQALHTGADIKTVQALAGHSNISTTSRYCHTTEERMEAAIEKLKFWKNLK